MSERQVDSIQAARKEARRRRRRKLMIRRTIIILAVLLVVLLAIAWGVMSIIGAQQSKKGVTTDVLAVKEILVEGDTRYSAEDIIATSGLYIGQSLFGVNKVQAHDALKEQMPYLDKVEIGNKGLFTLRIRVTETPVMGAVKLKKGWLILGENNKALERIEKGNSPEGALQILGATLAGETVGETLLDERSLRVCNTLVAATELYKLDGLTTIDMTDKTKVTLLINDRLKVILGNETNMPAQIEMLADTLPTLYENNGIGVKGELDMTTFADDDPDNDRVIYTPPELLHEEPKETTKKTQKTEKTETDGETKPTETTKPNEE